ncbi:MAG: mannose-1-phosphate guanylyltransferase [Candidatus Moraniibacteriota bacterium]
MSEKYAIILCGGSGTRLWPLSQSGKNAKQFLRLYSDKSLLQETYLRIRELMPTKNIFFSTSGSSSGEKVFQQIQEVDQDLNKNQIVIEPKKLNTAPAIMAAVRHMLKNSDIDEGEQIVILPADHYIKNRDEYLRVVQLAMTENGDNIGTIGIVPTGPETGYGYIEKGEEKKHYFQAVRFREKPGADKAMEYLQSGKYVWNSGMYIFSAKTFLGELRKHSPEMYALATVDDDMDFSEKFKKLESISIDYAVSEKSDKVVVFEGDFGWNDIGSFDSLSRISAGAENKILIDAQNVQVYGAIGKKVAVVGVSDLIVVEYDGCILVVKNGHSEDVKKVVDFLKQKEAEK